MRLMFKTLLETPGNVIDTIIIPLNKDEVMVQRAVALAVWEFPEEETRSMLTVGS